MPVAATARRLRAVLALTTACGALFPTLALAQSGQVRLPTESDVRDVRTDGLRPDFRDSSDKLRVDLRGRNTVINWDGFNIPEGKEIDFTDGRLAGSLRGDIAVLNRDVSSKPSQLLGKLSSDPNVAVWVHNANGILVGSKAAFNTGSLVLTTLDISPEDFVRAGDSYRLQSSAGSQAAITVEQGAKLRVDGSTRGLVMLAPKIDAHGEFVAEGQDVAFVTASDVTLDYRSGSPLSVTLNRGSAVAGTSQYVRGSVAGNNAIFALASQDTLTDSLLQVSAAVTTASAGSRGIVLSAGKPATAVSGVTVAGDAAATGGVARLLVDGALRTDNRDADVIAGASGALSLTGAVQTRDRLIAGSGALLEVTNNVTAGGDVLLSGRGVTLGGTDPVTQRAGGQFRVSSTDGDISGVGAVTLRSGDTGDSGLLLETLGSTGGNIALGSASRLIAGDDRRGGLTLSRRDTANSIDIGTVDARALRGAVGSGAVRSGNVNVREALSIGGSSVVTGNLASERAVEVRGSGAVTTGGIASGAGTTVVAGGALTIGGDVRASDDVSLRGSAVALDGATLRSGGGIDVTALNGGITGSRALAIVSSSGQRSNVVRLQAAGAVGIVLADGSSITGGTNRALDVRIFAASDAPLKLGDVTARSLGTIATLDGATANAGAFRSAGALTFGRLDLVDGFTAESTGGNLTVGRIAVSGALQGIDLRAAGTLSVQNDISTSGAVTLSSGAALTLGAIESRDRAVTLTSGGALRADRLTAATGVTAAGTSMTLGDVRGGTGAVLLTAGTGDLSLGSAAGRRVALEAAGDVSVAGGLTADAGAIDVSASRAISVAGAVRSTGGGVRIVSSGGPVGVTGGLTSDAAATLSGTALIVGGTHIARGAYSASASAGGITRNGSGLSIRSDGDASGAEGVTLNAAGGAIDLGDARITAGGTARLTTDGQGIAVGAVEAAGLVATGATAAGAAIRTGDLRVQGPVTLSATGDVATGAITTDGVVALTGNAVRFGNARASSLAATASGGAVSGGDLTAAGPVTLRAAGDVSTGAIGSDGAVTLAGNALRFGNIRATSLSATAASGAAVGGTVDTSGAVTVQASAGALTLGRVVTTQGDVVLSALGPVFVQGVNAGGTASIVGTGTGNDVSIVDGVASNGAVTVRSGRDIRTPFIRSATGALTVAAPNGRLAGFLAGTGTSLSAGAGQPFSLTVGTDAVLGDVVGGNIAITATAITANRIDGGALPVALNATVGDLTVTGPVTGSTVSLTAAGRALLGSVDASGAVTLGGAQGLSFDRVSGASISATGGAIRGNALSSTGGIVVQGADVTLDRIDADTLEAAASGALAINTVQATGSATLSGASGSFGSLTAGGSLGITTTGALRFDRLAAQNVAATAQGGTLTGGAVVTTGNATLAGQSIDLASVETGGSLSATSVDAMAIGSVRATGDATLLAGTTGTFGTVTTGGALGATSNGALRFDRLAGRTIAATATNGALTGTTLVATGDVALAGGSIEVGTVESGGALSARSVGSSTIGTVQASGDATLIAGTTGSYETVTAGGALSATAAGSLRFDRLTGRSVAASSQGGTLTGTAIVARSDAALGGQSIDVGSVESAGSLLADATAGGLRFGTIAAGGNATLRATGAATLGGAVTTGGAYRVTAGSIVLDGVQRAGGEVRMVATGAAITGGLGLTLESGTATGATTGGAPIVLDAAAGIDLSGATLRAGNGSALALRAGRGQAIRLGSVEAGSLGGFDGSAPTDRLTHDGSVTTGDLTLGRLAVTLTAGDLATGRIAATGPVSLIANTGSIRGGDLTAGTLEARAGSTLALGSATVGGSATLEAGTIDLRALTAQALTIRTAGTVGGANGGTTALRTTGGDLTVEAGTARLGSVESAGSATLRGGAIEVRERLSAARALLVEARSALTLQNAAAGADLSLASTGAVNAGDLTAGGALAVDGGGVTIGAARAGGALKATSSGGLSLGSGSGSGIVLDAVGLVRAGALAGGPSVSIRGADAELSGAIQGSSVRFATRDPATTALRIGDGTQGGGFRLSAAEVGQVAADTLAFDSGSGAMEIGTVALAPGVGRSVEMLSTGDVRVTGQVSASGAGRSIRIGGDGASGNAATIHLIATSDAGGRLLLGDNDLDLRGNRIAAGLAPGFLDTLAPGDAGRAQAQALIGNPNSSLYNSQLGGGFFAPDATTLVAARSMSVRFGDYALFQNTGVPGRSSGVTVGSLAAPVTPALRIATSGTPSAASFAFFGEINGVTGAGAALLGNPVIDIQPALLPNSRINGCLAGSGAGCLTTIVIQPTLQVFDWDSQAVFGILQDVSLPFTPIIGGNNEALLSGLPALAPETPADAAAPAPTVAVPPQQEPKP